MISQMSRSHTQDTNDAAHSSPADGAKRIVEQLRVFVFSVEAKEPVVKEQKDQRRHFNSESFMRLYSRVFHMCSAGYTRELCNMYVGELTTYLKERADRQIRDTMASSTSLSLTSEVSLSAGKINTVIGALRVWAERYGTFKHVYRGFSDAFMYLDRYLSTTPEADSLRQDIGFQKRKPLITKSIELYRSLAYSPHKRAASRCVVYLMECTRHQEVVQLLDDERILNTRASLAVIAKAIRPFYELFLQDDDAEIISQSPCGRRRIDYKIIETNLQAAARAYYTARAANWMHSLGVAGYVSIVERALQFESEASAVCLLHKSAIVMDRACRDSLLHAAQPAKFLAGRSNVLSLLQRSDLGMLRRIFNLYQNSKGSHMFEAAQALEHHATQELDRGVRSATGVKKAHYLASAHKQFSALLERAFDDHPTFVCAIERSFRSIMNRDANATAEEIAHAAHEVLRRLKGKASKEESVLLQRLPRLYALLREKDVFDISYQDKLQLRLLNQQVASESTEKALIARLREVAGYQWAKNLCGMLEDYKHSHNLAKEFSQSAGPPPFPTKPVVGRYGNWSVASRTSRLTLEKALLPEAAQKALSRFDRFYELKFASRKLSWSMDMGSAVVSVCFQPRSPPVDLVVTTIQMIVLSCFSNAATVNFSTLSKALGFVGDDGVMQAARNPKVNDHILSLLHPELGPRRVLQKKPAGRVISTTDQFRLNPKFNSGGLRVVSIKLRKGLAPSGPAAIDKKSQEIQTQILRQRRHIMDATLVQIMKHRKRMTHADLLAEATSRIQGRFTPIPAELKKRIENLIEQEYIKRDEQSRGVYHYLA